MHWWKYGFNTILKTDEPLDLDETEFAELAGSLWPVRPDEITHEFVKSVLKLLCTFSKFIDSLQWWEDHLRYVVPKKWRKLLWNDLTKTQKLEAIEELSMDNNWIKMLEITLSAIVLFVKSSDYEGNHIAGIFVAFKGLLKSRRNIINSAFLIWAGLAELRRQHRGRDNQVGFNRYKSVSNGIDLEELYAYIKDKPESQK